MLTDNNFDQIFHRLENINSSIGMGINYVKKGSEDSTAKLEIIEKIKDRVVDLNIELGRLKEFYFNQKEGS